MESRGTLRREEVAAQEHRLKFERIWAECGAAVTKLEDVLSATARSVMAHAGRRQKFACASRFVRGVLAALPKLPPMIYIMGGEVEMGDSLRDVERYDGEGWEAVADLPRGLRYMGAVALGGHVHVVGGAPPLVQKSHGTV